MKNSVHTYWDKSKENLAVTENARAAGYYNAAASRYYYALVLGGFAVLEREKMLGDWISHLHFIAQIASLLEEKKLGERDEMCDALEEAYGARAKADYEPFPVEPRHLDHVLQVCRPILEALEIELK
jgi:uncharacterized protein (UPF0332 family)